MNFYTTDPDSGCYSRVGFYFFWKVGSGSGCTFSRFESGWTTPGSTTLVTNVKKPACICSAEGLLMSKTYLSRYSSTFLHNRRNRIQKYTRAKAKVKSPIFVFISAFYNRSELTGISSSGPVLYFLYWARFIFPLLGPFYFHLQGEFYISSTVPDLYFFWVRFIFFLLGPFYISFRSGMKLL